MGAAKLPSGACSEQLHSEAGRGLCEDEWPSSLRTATPLFLREVGEAAEEGRAAASVGGLVAPTPDSLLPSQVTRRWEKSW